MVVDLFADLLWPPMPSDPEEFDASLEDEPAFLALSAARYVALHRISGEIRYFAAPIASESGWAATGPRSPGDSDDEPYEMGVLASAEDAAEFFWQYHLGTPLAEIQVPRQGR
jgi:hypothetical protein